MNPYEEKIGIPNKVSVIKMYAHKTKTLQLNVLKQYNLMRKWMGNILKYLKEKYRFEGKCSLKNDEDK
jgi:hypothetical protein